MAAARALIDVDGIGAEAIAQKSMKIAADTCIYTNHNCERPDEHTHTHTPL